ncbi:MAG TPA: tetratricopeptide repeat protein [Vicinamibacterales bacterium]|nr:tetratricopeptide repeat protein [Vicinamibacterales bacterium]
MIGACMAAIAILIAAAPQIRTAPDYAGLVQQYRSGNPDAAIEGVSGLSDKQLIDGLGKFMAVNQDRALLEAAAAMHIEAALRPRFFVTLYESMRHLSIATGLVEWGQPANVPKVGTKAPRSKVSVAPPFRRLVFLAAIAALQNSGRASAAADYLESARLLFPHDAAVLLFSAISEEGRASGRLGHADEATRRKSLGDAEVYLRESVELNPEEIEAKLRLGRVLAQREKIDEARQLLTRVADGTDTRLSYLASLFLGGLEDAAGRADDAGPWYDRAAARMPSAQSARLAGSELRHRAGARREAAVEAAAAIGPDNSNDPWWGYVFGEPYWAGLYLDAMREMSRS